VSIYWIARVLLHICVTIVYSYDGPSATKNNFKCPHTPVNNSTSLRQEAEKANYTDKSDKSAIIFCHEIVKIPVRAVSEYLEVVG